MLNYLTLDKVVLKSELTNHPEFKSGMEVYEGLPVQLDQATEDGDGFYLIREDGGKFKWYDGMIDHEATAALPSPLKEFEERQAQRKFDTAFRALIDLPDERLLLMKMYIEERLNR